MSDIMRCPECGRELDEDNYCFECGKYIDDEDFNEDFDSGLDDVDYDSRVNNGDAICLNCTFWSVSPHGSAYGMICRRGYFTEGPGDSCGDFIPETR